MLDVEQINRCKDCKQELCKHTMEALVLLNRDAEELGHVKRLLQEHGVSVQDGVLEALRDVLTKGQDNASL